MISQVNVTRFSLDFLSTWILKIVRENYNKIFLIFRLMMRKVGIGILNDTERVFMIIMSRSLWILTSFSVKILNSRCYERENGLCNRYFFWNEFFIRIYDKIKCLTKHRNSVNPIISWYPKTHIIIMIIIINCQKSQLLLK